MRWFYITVVCLFVAAIVIFSFQNLQVVTLSFLGFQLRAPVAVLTVIIYLLGMATGSSLIALLKKWVSRARR